jgi:hypothetical protein
VGLGLRLRAHLRLAAHRDEFIAEFAGPRQAGETVAVTLGVDEVPTVLSGRIVDSRGRPLADRFFQLSLAEPSAISSGRTTAQGHFRVALSYSREPARNVAISISLGPGQGFARGLIDRLEPGRECHLGNLLFRETRVLAAGIAVDALGQPVARESLRLWTRDEDGWAPVPELERSTTGPTGDFAFWGWMTLLPHELRITGIGGVSEIFLEGRRDVRVVLHSEPAWGWLEGRVVLPPGLGSSAVVLRTVPADAPPDHDDVRSNVLIHRDQSFRQMLRPGRWRLHTTTRATRRDVIPPIHFIIEPGVTSHPAGLQPLDLGDVIRPIDVTVAESMGLPVPHASLMATWDLRGKFVATNADEEGRARFAIGSEPVDLVVRARGYRPMVLARCVEDRRVALRPGIPLALTLRDLPPLPEGLQVTLRLEPIDLGLEDVRIRRVIQDETLETRTSPVLFVLPAAGTWRVHWKADGFVPRSIGGTTRTKDYRWAEVSPETPDAFLQIEDGDQPQRRELVIPPEIRAVLEGSR